MPGPLVCGYGGAFFRPQEVPSGVGGYQDEGWGVVNKRTGKTTFATREIPGLMAAARAGVVFQAHGRAVCGMAGKPCVNRTQPCWSPLPDYREPAAQDELAAFLVAMGECRTGQRGGCVWSAVAVCFEGRGGAGGVTPCGWGALWPHRSRLVYRPRSLVPRPRRPHPRYSYFACGVWENYPADASTWNPVYDLPLGRPLHHATLGEDGVWRRAFASGTAVSFDTRTGRGNVSWARGSGSAAV